MNSTSIPSHVQSQVESPVMSTTHSPHLPSQVESPVIWPSRIPSQVGSPISKTPSQVDPPVPRTTSHVPSQVPSQVGTSPLPVILTGTSEYECLALGDSSSPSHEEEEEEESSLTDSDVEWSIRSTDHFKERHYTRIILVILISNRTIF